MRARSYALTALLLLACQAVSPELRVASSAQAQAAGELAVEGSGFLLRLPDGRTLRGVELEGATLHLAFGEGPPRPIRLTSISADPDDPDVLRHRFEQPDGDRGWTALCDPDHEGERWGFPIALPEGHPGREGPITLTCASGAVGKCVRFGYKPWRPGPRGEDLLPLHAACVQMVRADYCGQGQPHTRDGTLIQVYDDLGVLPKQPAMTESFTFEAGWTPRGAACIAHPRWRDLGKVETLRAQCPRLAALPFCDEAAARAAGARLFNLSVAQ